MANWDGETFDQTLTPTPGYTQAANPLGTKTSGVLWPRAIRGAQR